MKTLSEISADFALESRTNLLAALDQAEAFTAGYHESAHQSAAEREATLLRIQYPAILQPVEAGDLFAGRIRYGLIGLSPEPVGLGHYCATGALKVAREENPDLTERIDALLGYWQGRTTKDKVRSAYPEALSRQLPSDAWTEDSGVGFPLYRMAGTNLDYGYLVELGLDGLESEAEGSPFSFVPSVLRTSIDHYVDEARDAIIAETLRAIRHAPPGSFRQAIQLIWIYALHAGTWNYGRLDDVIGPYLVQDLESGEVTRDEALDLLCSWWRLMHAYNNQYNNRVWIGGRGRTNEEAADEFALLAIDATRRVRLNQPQLSMRFYQGQNPALWERAIDAIGEGCTFPMLYNDDVNVPAVANAFRIDEDMAVNYTPYGCGEYVLGHYSEGSPNGVINLLKALELALHGGRDPVNGRKTIDVPTVEAMQTFEDVWDAYVAILEPNVEALARQEKLEYEVVATETPFAFISLLTRDCLERGLSAFGGGARYLGGTLETYGNTNASDSLHAIDELVFRRKVIDLPGLVAALDANFDGHDDLLKLCRSVSKYGNDEGTSDAMARRVHEHICELTRSQAEKVGLDSYLVVIINNWANTVLGWKTSASAEGRLAGQPMANGNNPSSGSDVSGVTAFLNSLARLDPSVHAGAVQNMKFSKEWFGEMRPKFDALLRTYFLQGGTQAMITVVSRDDLEAAMREPENWGHLMVRVGGFSIRFVDLPQDAQLEVLARTLN